MVKKRGFTLAEVLVVLALLGILAAILLPAIANIRPSKSKMMFRKAYYTAERMVYELVNDDDLYPATDGTHSGFDNTSKVPYAGSEYSGNSKFCNLFAKKVNTVKKVTGTNCNTTITPAGSGTFKTPTFSTTDSVAWYLPVSNFSTTQSIYVDVNGADKPNCSYNSTSCPKPDIFRIYVDPDGKMYVDGTKEEEYLEHGLNMRDNT